MAKPVPNTPTWLLAPFKSPTVEVFTLMSPVSIIALFFLSSSSPSEIAFTASTISALPSGSA